MSSSSTTNTVTTTSSTTTKTKWSTCKKVAVGTVAAAVIAGAGYAAYKIPAVKSLIDRIRGQ